MLIHMESTAIIAAKKAIEAEPDPTLKSQMMASLCSALFREHGVETGQRNSE